MKQSRAELIAFTLLGLACSPTMGGDPGGTGGEPAASGGVVGSGGAAATGGGGSAATGGASGGVPGTGGVGTGGAAPSGGAHSGGSEATGGAPAGGSSGSGGEENLLAIAQSIDGLRVDDPCTGTPTVSTGATCDHVELTAGAFHAAEEVTIGGSDGTTYDVTIRIRGVVEPANVVGGTRPPGETFSYMGLDWRQEPWTEGGTVPAEDTDYAQWRLVVGQPSAVYYLNDYQRVGHYIFELDYEATLPMQAGTKLTLEAIDDNERLILNYEGYAPDGIAGSSNHGQFVQLELVAVTAQ